MALTYLALGDSYTIGEGVDANQRWPIQLATALRAEGTALGVPGIIAASGWTTDDLSAGLDANEPMGTFDLVSLLIGVNNQYRGRSTADYAGEFARLLARAITLARGRNDAVLVVSIPDWGVTPFGQASGRDLGAIARELDAYNAAAQARCARDNVAFVDITTLNRHLGHASNALVADGLHPSAWQYQQWVQRLLPTARRMTAGMP